eukprot:Polyplicarium_translucidae@DN3329_c1_g1_i4.p2
MAFRQKGVRAEAVRKHRQADTETRRRFRRAKPHIEAELDVQPQQQGEDADFERRLFDPFGRRPPPISSPPPVTRESHKRRRLSSVDDNDDADAADSQRTEKTPKFAKQLAQRKLAEERQEAAAAEAEAAMRRREEEIRRKKSERKQKTRVYLKRTAKGQPRLGLQVEALLEKITAAG